MLRPYFMDRRDLLGDLGRLSYETINELLSEAAGDPKARPGVVAVAQTFGSVLNAHPHTHCLASRGVWDEKGQWLPVPYIDTTAAEKLFAHKILRLQKSKNLLSDERMQLLLSFRNSGFSVDTSPTVWPQDTQGLETCLDEALAKADGFADTYFAAPSASHAFTGPQVPGLCSTKAKAHMTTLCFHIPKVRASIFSSSSPESSLRFHSRASTRFTITVPMLRGPGFTGKSAASRFTPPVTTTTRNQRPNPNSHQKNVQPLEKVGPSSSNGSIKSIL